MGAEKRLLSVKEAFQLAQQPHQNQAKLVVALSRTYGTVSAALLPVQVQVQVPGLGAAPGPAQPSPGVSGGPWD
jgi:hypothetical protein